MTDGILREAPDAIKKAEQRGYQRGYHAVARNRPLQTRVITRWVGLPEARRPSPQDRICAAARDIDEALTFWRVHTVGLMRDAVRLIPDSKAAVNLYLKARRGELPLCNYLPSAAATLERRERRTEVNGAVEGPPETPA